MTANMINHLARHSARKYLSRLTSSLIALFEFFVIAKPRSLNYAVDFAQASTTA
jgi:hypothetical protein